MIGIIIIIPGELAIATGRFDPPAAARSIRQARGSVLVRAQFLPKSRRTRPDLVAWDDMTTADNRNKAPLHPVAGSASAFDGFRAGDDPVQAGKAGLEAALPQLSETTVFSAPDPRSGSACTPAGI